MEALGIEPKLLLAQIVNFIIVIMLLRKFLYNPILDMLDTRKEKIARGLEEAELASQKLNSAESKAAQIIAEADKEAKSIREDAKIEIKKFSDKAMKDANEKAAKLIASAKEEAASLKENALKSAKKELSEVMIAAMDKVLGSDLDANQKQLLTAKAIKEI